MPPRRLIDAVNELDPASRALLDLSLRLGVDDGELGSVLALEPGDVARRRQRLLEGLAAEQGRDPGAAQEVERELRELPAEEWSLGAAAADGMNGGEPGAAPHLTVVEGDASETMTGPEAEAAEATEADESGTATSEPPSAPAEAEPADRRRGPRLAGILVTLAVLAAIVIVASVVGSEDGEVDGSAGDGAAAEDPGAGESEGRGEEAPTGGGDAADDRAEAPAAAALEPLPATDGEVGGTARVTGSGEEARLELQVRGLDRPPASYEVWLYDSVIDSVSLGRLDDDGSLEATLPADAGEFGLLDVSLERGSDPGHSGASVLRVPLEDLLPEA